MRCLWLLLFVVTLNAHASLEEEIRKLRLCEAGGRVAGYHPNENIIVELESVTGRVDDGKIDLPNSPKFRVKIGTNPPTMMALSNVVPVLPLAPGSKIGKRLIELPACTFLVHFSDPLYLERRMVKFDLWQVGTVRVTDLALDNLKINEIPRNRENAIVLREALPWAKILVYRESPPIPDAEGER